MKIICAGSGSGMYGAACIEHRMHRLHSFLVDLSYIKRWDANTPLLVDSGAHSWNKFTITKIGHTSSGNLPAIPEYLNKYAAFMLEHRDRPWMWVEFDVYGHLGKSEIDAQYERFTTIVGRDKFMRVYHPIIDGGTLKVLDEWIAQGQKYIGIGNDSIPFLDPIFYRTRDKVKIHGFAMTKYHLMTKYPFYSVDSTSPLSPLMYGQITRASLKRYTKEAAARHRDPNLFRTPEQNCLAALRDIKRTEAELTQLWAARGVIWND
jgi:hypothetical protein